MSTLPTVPNSLPLTDEQAKAITASANLGTTVVTEGSNLARYMGRVLGTAPQDAVGLVIGDRRTPVRSLSYRRAVRRFARQDFQQEKRQRNSAGKPVGGDTLASGQRMMKIGRSFKNCGAALMASAMDPQRAGRVRLSFIETLKHFDPLDALVLKPVMIIQGIYDQTPLRVLRILLKSGRRKCTFRSTNSRF